MNYSTDSVSKFIETHPHGNIFQTHEMFEVFKKTKNYVPIILVVKDHGEISGILSAVIQKEYSGVLGLFTARSIIWGGPLVKNNDLQILDRILKKYISEISDKVIYTQFRNLWKFTQAEKDVFVSNGFKYEEHLDIIHDLTVSIDEQLEKMHSGRRKNIGRAERLNLIFTEINSNEEFIDSLNLVINTYKRIKLPMPDKSFFLEAFNSLHKKGNLKTFALKYDNEIISIRMVLCYKDLIYDWYAGTSDNHLDKYPNDYLPWMVMKWGTANKYRYFDFGGAGKPNIHYGVREYKLKFGGKLVSFGRFEKIHKPLMYNLAKVGLNAWKFLKR